jgi:hypothetical protein
VFCELEARARVDADGVVNEPGWKIACQIEHGKGEGAYDVPWIIQLLS